MSPTSVQALSGEIVEQTLTLSIRDLSRICTVEASRIVELVDEGILTVQLDAAGEWQFSGETLRRARIALRLQRDLEINLPGVALALELLAEIEQLRRARLQGT
ncbi:MAG: chaperone modulator CbpM [Steroidobacteraceae bacterium]|jgi:chaperone modulatory protein CbpM